MLPKDTAGIRRKSFFRVPFRRLLHRCWLPSLLASCRCVHPTECPESCSHPHFKAYRLHSVTVVLLLANWLNSPGTVDCRDRIFVITCMLEKLDEVVSGNNSGRYDISNRGHVDFIRWAEKIHLWEDLGVLRMELCNSAWNGERNFYVDFDVYRYCCVSLEFESARLCEGQRKVPGAIMKSLRDAFSVPNPMWWRIHVVESNGQY